MMAARMLLVAMSITEGVPAAAVVNFLPGNYNIGQKETPPCRKHRKCIYA